MTLEAFKKHKLLIRESLERNLAKDILMVNNGVQTYREDSVITRYKEIKILKEDNIVLKLKKLDKEINKLRAVSGVTISQRAITKMEHCHKSFEGTLFTVYYKELRTSITDKQVEDIMRKYVSKMLTSIEKRNTGYIWERVSVDCKVMDLFKQGKISWEDCVEAHKIECKF